MLSAWGLDPTHVPTRSEGTTAWSDEDVSSALFGSVEAGGLLAWLEDSVPTFAWEVEAVAFLFKLAFGFFSTFELEAFSDEEVVLSFEPHPPKASPSDAATREAAVQRINDRFIISPLYLSDLDYTPIVTDVKYFL